MTRSAVTGSVRSQMPAMIRLNSGTSELSTAAVPESTWTSPQLMRKMGIPALMSPRMASGASSRGLRGSRTRRMTR